jgi:DNA-directed RNA polymerase specialized sigma24 family protein
MKITASAQDEYLQASITAARVRTAQVAARQALSQAEREDFEQEITLALLERKDRFDPRKGSLGTFTGMISKNRSIELVHDLIGQRTVFGAGFTGSAANDPDMGRPLEARDEVAYAASELDDDVFPRATHRHDSSVAMAFMNSEQKAVYDLLLTHQDIADAVKASGMSTATFYRRLTDLRMHLRMFGIRPAA